MQINWSILLNIVLLLVVVVAIRRLMKAEKSVHQNDKKVAFKSTPVSMPAYQDDVLSVRKIDDFFEDGLMADEGVDSRVSFLMADRVIQPDVPSSNVTKSNQPTRLELSDSIDFSLPKMVMICLQSPPNRPFSGYELLQTLLALGLRFGEGQLFHRHQHANGQGPVLCSLAAATETGTFDLANMGAFSAKGLFLFMYTSGNAQIDGERFYIMMDTAKQIAEEVHGTILNDKQQPLTNAYLTALQRALGVPSEDYFLLEDIDVTMA